MENDIESVWTKACGLLAETLSKDVYDRWISVIQPRALTEETLTLNVANDFYHSWLEENYVPLIEHAVVSVCGRPISITLSVDKSKNALKTPPENRKPAPAAVEAIKPAHRKVVKSQAVLNPKYTFDSFVVGPSNNFAHAASMAVAQSPARAYNPLFIYGGVGLGKTHLMQAIGNYAIAKHNLNICFISSEAFVNDYIDALQRKSLVQFRKKYRCADILFIDDIQFLSGKERMQEEFFHTFNALFDSHKQIVLSSDRPACEIPDLEHRLVSRFEWGLVTELEKPDIETRIAILKKKMESLNIQLADEALYYIAEHIRSNIRRLEGALIRAASFASLTGQNLTIEALENLLRDAVDQEKQKTTLTLESIQRTVAEYYDIRFSDMTSKRRPASIAFPRQMAMYLCRDLTPSSLPAIGEAFNKNHATVLHACRLIDRRVKEDPAIRQTMTLLRQRLTTSN